MARIPFTFQEMIRILFYSYRFSKIAWLIDIPTESIRRVVGEELEDDNFEEYIELIMQWGELYSIRIDRFLRISGCDDADHFS